MKTKAAIPFYFCFALMMLLLLAGCMSTQKATDYLQRKGQLAPVCAAAFPVHDSTIVKDSINSDTLYLATPEVVTTDTIQVAGKPVVMYKTLKCPPTQIITKTVNHDSIIIRENTAKVTALQQQFDKQSVKLSEAETGRSHWRLWCLITWLIVGGFIAIKILNPIKLPI